MQHILNNRINDPMRLPSENMVLLRRMLMKGEHGESEWCNTRLVQRAEQRVDVDLMDESQWWK